MYNIGDRVRTVYGNGIIKDIPNEAIAWVLIDGSPEHEERGLMLLNSKKNRRNCGTR